MKNIKLFLLMITLSGALWTSCNDLDIEPLSVLNENQVFSSDVGINSAIATLYARLPMSTFNADVYYPMGNPDMPFANWNNSCNITGESLVCPLRVAMAFKTFEGGFLSWWDYSSIRYCNVAIQGLLSNKKLYASRQTEFNHWLGEAYFCRAYMSDER